MLIISREQVEGLLDRLGDRARLGESRGELEKMLEIKSALLWKTTDGMQPCCGSFCSIKNSLDAEVKVLEEALAAFDRDDISRASSLLKDYIDYMELLER